MLKSPFKFLDSYTLADKDNFFGREHEITDLYRRVFEGKMLLVYGISGTGKSSLINCGLASRFDDSDWLPINIRRGHDINESINDAFNKLAIWPLKKNISVSEKLQSIYLDNFKPIYLIFDQFEELFIFGSKEEKADFLNLIKEIILSETKCHIIFIIREEFLAWITEFEFDLPEIFSNRYRVEKMKRANAINAVEGPCKKNNIEAEQGFSEELIDKLSSSSKEIELTFLQIYLDRIFQIALKEKQPEGYVRFSNEILNKAGSVSDLLGQFLEEQIKELDDPDIGMTVLKSFVSVQGTKRQMNVSDIINSISTLGKVISEVDLLRYLTKFVDFRLLRERDVNGYFELIHDSIASKIYEKFSAIEKDVIEVRYYIDNAFAVYKKREKYLTLEDLKYIAPYEDKLYLSKAVETFIHKSKNEITRANRRRRNILSITSLALIIVLVGFTLWALGEKHKSGLNYLIARANSFNFLSQKIAEADPTIALRLAEYAVSIDSINPDIIQNLNRIYYDNSFYKIVSRHNRNITSVAFSPDGKNILTGSQDSTARLWDLKGNLLQVFRGHTDRIYSVTFSPDSKTVLTGSMDNSAILWDLKGNILQVFKGHKGIVYSVSFSPDGQSVLTGSMDKTARLWNLHGVELQIFRGHTDNISSVAFSHGGKNILTGSNDYTARLWDLNGNTLKVFSGLKVGITSVAFSPDDKEICTGSMDSLARLWDINGKVIKVFKSHVNIITSISFSANGKHLITGSWDKTIRLWDLNGQVLQVFKGHEAEIEAVAFSPDGKSILSGSGDKTARIWEVSGILIQEFRGHEDAVNSVTFSPDGKSLLTGSNDNTARLWDLLGNVKQVFKGHEDAIWSVAFSPDGKNILTGSSDNTARLWDIYGNTLSVFRGHNGMVSAVAFSPDGKRILTGSDDNTAVLWDLNGNILKVFRGHEGSIKTVAFSPDGKSILSGSWDKTVRLWSIDGTLLQLFTGQDGYINSVGFSPDGKNIFSGSWDKTVRLMDLNGNLLQVFKGNDGFVLSVAFSPDGKNILTVGSSNSFINLRLDDKSAYLWDLSGHILQTFSGHTDRIKSVAFSPDGESVLTGSWDKTARLWEVKNTHKEFQTSDLYQALSISQKLEYGILDFNAVIKLDDEKSLNESAEYYFNKLNIVSEGRNTYYLNNAIRLYSKLFNKYKNTAHSANLELLKKMQKN